MTDRLGLAPDRAGVRGSRHAEPPRPVCHSWTVECRTPGLTVDEQIAEVLDRIRAVADGIRSLVSAGGTSAVLQVVRYFDADDGEPEHHGGPLAVLAGQHQLLGWHLTAADMAFLSSIPAELDIDEYG